MKTVFLPSSAWIRHRGRCECLIERIVCTHPDQPEFIIVDAATVQREAIETLLDGSFKVEEVDFRAWVNESLTEGGVINVEVIRRAAARMAGGGAYAINAIGFDSATIHRALNQLRMGFYPLEVWPQSVVLIGDDSQLNQLSPALAHTFYIQPSVMTKAAMDRMVRRVTHEARILRLFGRRVGFSVRWVARWIDWSSRRKERKQEKQLGWFWEE